MSTCSLMMDHAFSVQAMVCGYHYYKDIWEAAIDGEVLSCEREVGNVHDAFAVAVKKDDIIVGHCPQKIFLICSIFIRCGGSVTCQVNGNRCYSHDLPQGGLEVPCILTFHISEKTLSDKTKRLITNALSTEIELSVPLLPINFNSAGNSNNNSCNSEIKIKSEPIRINEELSASETELSEITETVTSLQLKGRSYPAKKSKILLWVMSFLIPILIWHKVY